jgi:hypothetical protein
MPGIARFFEKYAVRALNGDEQVTALKLMELQRHALLMYTSCGWFFNELSRPEPLQVIQYAGRVVQLAQDLFNENIEASFLYILEQAKSNKPEQGDGRRIYESMVRPAALDLTRVAAHYAINSLFHEYNEENRIYCYTVNNEDYGKTDCGKSRLVVGRLRVTSSITWESGVFSYGVFHLGGHVINAGVRRYQGEEAYQAMVKELSRACASADFTGVIRLLDKHFGSSTYSLKSLFRDEQRDVLDHILESTMMEIETAYRQLYEHHYPPMRFLSELGGPVPKAFHSAAELIINIDLHRLIDSDDMNTADVKNLVETAKTWQVELDADGIGYDLKTRLEKMAGGFAKTPENIGQLKALLDAVALARSLPFAVDLWNVQNIYWDLLQNVYPPTKRKAEQKDAAAIAWVNNFTMLGNNLTVRVE